MIGRIGMRGYLAVFSLVSIVLMAAMVWAYGSAPARSSLWLAGAPLRLVIAIAMLVPFWLAVMGVSVRNPAAVGGDAVLETSAVPHGVFTVTRHPLMVAIAIWAGLHLIANPDLPSLAFFGTLAVTAVTGTRLQDRRKESEIGTAWRRYMAQTSIMPMRAVIEGRTRLDLAGLDLWRTIAALVAWAIVLNLHGDLFGVPALTF